MVLQGPGPHNSGAPCGDLTHTPLGPRPGSAVERQGPAKSPAEGRPGRAPPVGCRRGGRAGRDRAGRVAGGTPDLERSGAAAGAGLRGLRALRGRPGGGADRDRLRRGARGVPAVRVRRAGLPRRRRQPGPVRAARPAGRGDRLHGRAARRARRRDGQPAGAGRVPGRHRLVRVRRGLRLRAAGPPGARAGLAAAHRAGPPAAGGPVNGVVAAVVIAVSLLVGGAIVVLARAGPPAGGRAARRPAGGRAGRARAGAGRRRRGAARPAARLRCRVHRLRAGLAAGAAGRRGLGPVRADQVGDRRGRHQLPGAGGRDGAHAAGLGLSPSGAATVRVRHPSLSFPESTRRCRWRR